MASNDKWIRRVLYKLNELFLEGSDFEDRRWLFDWDDKLTIAANLENVWNEDRALETLTKADVIASRSIENRYRSQQLEGYDLHGKDHLVYPDWHHTDPAHREYEWIRALDGFNFKNFQRFSELHGFNPSSEGVLANLEIISGVTPIVEAQAVRYTLPTLSAGAVTQKIIAYAAQNFDKQLSLSDLQQNVDATQLTKKGANISQLFRKSLFATDKVLTRFADLAPKSFTLKRKVLLTPAELEAIRKASTR